LLLFLGEATLFRLAILHNRQVGDPIHPLFSLDITVGVKYALRLQQAPFFIKYPHTLRQKN